LYEIAYNKPCPRDVRSYSVQNLPKKSFKIIEVITSMHI
jgi:hypothetical protein